MGAVGGDGEAVGVGMLGCNEVDEGETISECGGRRSGLLYDG
jgi:hypothetical protein